VPGYPSNSDVLLALERKEVDAWSALATTIKLAADRGAVRPLVRGRVALPGFENLPIDEDLATSALGKSLMAIKSIPGAIGRAFAVPPATPSDRIAQLRDAFAKAIKDPELIAEAKKAKIEVQYIGSRASAEGFQRADESNTRDTEGDGQVHQSGKLSRRSLGESDRRLTLNASEGSVRASESPKRTRRVYTASSSLIAPQSDSEVR
jgi:hypothetical protein